MTAMEKKKDESPYARDARALQECIELEGVKTPIPNPQVLALITVVAHSWGQGDALAGAMIHRMISRQENAALINEWYRELFGRVPLMTSPMTLLHIFGELAKGSITFKYLERAGRYGGVVNAMKKAKKEIVRRKGMV